jgi:hypothetical protein
MSMMTSAHRAVSTAIGVGCASIFAEAMSDPSLAVV